MSFQKWISVKVEHGYFADHRCPPMRFEPTGDCRDRMRRGGQFFYPMPNGFHIFQDTGKVKKDQNGAGGPCFFDIAAYSTDSLLGNYSNLEIDYRRGSVYYVSNVLTKGEEENKEKRLTLTERAGDKQTEALPVLLKPKQFLIQPDDAAAGDTFKLLDGSGMVVKEQQVKDNGGGFALYADVSGRGGGLYRLEKNGAAAASFYADDGLNNTRPAFIVGIEANWTEEVAVRAFDIQIAARVVPWHYYVTARANGRKLENLSIRNTNEKSLPGVSFERVRVDEEGRGVEFVSSVPVPLSERAHQSIELIEEGNNGTPLIPHLPNAGISTLHVKEGKWVSQIHVYI